MNEPRTLDLVAPGERVIVKRLNTNGDMRRRFLDLGLIENTPIECIGKSPGGDPAAYLIRGAVIAIRAKDCRGIIVSSPESEVRPWD